MNHCDYFEIYLKAKSLRRLHIRNKKGKFRQVSLFFFLRQISFTLSDRDFHARFSVLVQVFILIRPESFFSRPLRLVADPEASSSHSIAPR